ncbi:GNAT family N-acetyltransferase [Scytonema sp. NUACC21]
MTVSIQRLQNFPFDCFKDMIAESLDMGFMAVQRLADDWVSGANRFDRHGEALFIAKGGGSIIGVCGLNIDPYATFEGTGRVRHLYVISEYRRRGIGRALVERVVDEARLSFNRLHLRTHSHQADKFYRAIGFSSCDGDEYCTHILELHR